MSGIRFPFFGLVLCLVVLISTGKHFVEAGYPALGSNGCSISKYSSDGGWCWRNCEGSAGAWCYTGKGCSGDEVSCSVNSTCAGFSCSIADPDCVLSCPDPTSNKPVGVADCSTKYTADNGWCWRSCNGDSGDYCYTSKGCSSNPTTCNSKAYCGGLSCVNGSPGCVDSCSRNASYVLPTKPTGSTGCSLQDKFETGNCWRYCSGSSGTWCYTGTDCVSNEDNCAYKTTCSGYSCPSGIDGCVTSCPQNPILRPLPPIQQGGTECVTYFERTQTQTSGLSSWTATWYTVDVDKDSRGTSSDTAVVANVVTQPAGITHDEFRRRLAGSNTLYCAATDYGTLRTFLAVILALNAQVGTRPLQINVVRPNDPTNPITEAYRRFINVNSTGTRVYRTEMIHATILPGHRRPGVRVDFPSWTSNYMRRYMGALPGDVRFHLMASGCGGPPELYNMVSGHQSVNNNVGVPVDRRQNDWPSVERAIRFHLDSNTGNYVEWYVHLTYPELSDERPTHITYYAELHFGNGAQTEILTGVARNEQL